MAKQIPRNVGNEGIATPNTNGQKIQRAAGIKWEDSKLKWAIEWPEPIVKQRKKLL